MSKTNEKQTSAALLPGEIRDSEQELVQLCQREAFLEEYKALSSRKPLPKRSRLLKLNPMLDGDGCIRSTVLCGVPAL